MSIPGSTNGCFDHLIYLHGVGIFSESVYGFFVAVPHGLISISSLYESTLGVFFLRIELVSL